MEVVCCCHSNASGVRANCFTGRAINFLKGAHVLVFVVGNGDISDVAVEVGRCGDEGCVEMGMCGGGGRLEGCVKVKGGVVVMDGGGGRCGGDG